jgi:hypothetical protein
LGVKSGKPSQRGRRKQHYTVKKKAAGPEKEEISTVKKKPGPWAALMSVEKGATFSLYMMRLKRNLWLLKDGMYGPAFCSSCNSAR